MQNSKPKEIKILMLRPRLEVGGACTYMQSLSKGLLDRGQWVGVASTFGDDLNVLGDIPVKLFYSPMYPSTINQLVFGSIKIARICKKYKIDLIHSHHRFTSLIGSLVSYFLKIPLVVTLHEFHDDWKLLAPFWNGDITIVPSNILRTHQIEYYNIDPQKVITIYNGIPNAHEPVNISDEQANLIKEKSGYRIGYVGRFAEEKGVRYFIESIPQILENFPNTEFLLIGDGNEINFLKDLASDLGIFSRVHFLGFQHNPNWLYHAVDLLVIPSLSESLGLVAIEAMRAKCPIVASDVGGLKEVVLQGVTGIRVPPGQPAEIAEAVVSLLQDEEKRLKMGNAGYDYFLKTFTLDKMLIDIEKVYQDMVR